VVRPVALGIDTGSGKEGVLKKRSQFQNASEPKLVPSQLAMMGDMSLGGTVVQLHNRAECMQVDQLMSALRLSETAWNRPPKQIHFGELKSQCDHVKLANKCAKRLQRGQRKVTQSPLQDAFGVN